ncbi:hypothetical protein HGRIS_011645 [Hohenbuehelia grisea]|uniref:Uncharacterized protein n=1 Tax=Hohenbuehelia grisea TaxID=104357 RepID=A0ABR3JVR0_9AGAR
MLAQTIACMSVTPLDIAFARHALLHFFPRELINHILVLVNYSPRVVTRSDQELAVIAPFTEHNDIQKVYLLSSAIPHEPTRLPEKLQLLDTMHIRSVKFTFVSHDQGWGGQVEHKGSYRETWSWFEAAIIRNGEPKGELGLSELQFNGKSRWDLQRNRHAFGDRQEHVVTWFKSTNHDEALTSVLLTRGSGPGIGFVDALREGDQVAIIARARYPGWANRVYSAEIDIDISV